MSQRINYEDLKQPNRSLRTKLYITFKERIKRSRTYSPVEKGKGLKEVVYTVGSKKVLRVKEELYFIKV